MSRPLLVVDGDNFAHRSYHALPKSIRRRGNRGGGAIVGFANLLLRLYESERPRAVLVGWDTLGAPTYRQKLFPPYQGGRQFDDEIVEQLDVLPELVAACGFGFAKAAGYEADINAFSNKLDNYNERLAGLDPFQNELDELEVFLREKSTRILAATEGHYGPDSDEYEQVGGTRKSDRKRPGPRKAKPRAAQSASPADGAVHADRTEEVKDAGR